ncbi:MAG: ATP-binding protein [Oscillospiraceae bacterium]
MPGLTQLVAQQTAVGTAAAGLAAAGMAEQAAAKRAELQGIAKRRALLLAQHGYTEADLRPRYSCPLCKDTGYRGGAMCSCVIEEAKRLRRQEINQAGPLRLCSFASFSVQRYPESKEGVAASPRAAMQHILGDCRDYAEDFGPQSPSLFMYGDAGLGKTHLALSIAAQVLEAGFDVIYVSAQSAFSAIGKDRYENTGEGLFQSMLEADLLVVDDLGTEYLDAYTGSRFYELVNTRLNRRPTIYTTNICKQDLLNQRYTEKIASRLLGECHLMRFIGRDLRLYK